MLVLTFIVLLVKVKPQLKKKKMEDYYKKTQKLLTKKLLTKKQLMKKQLTKKLLTKKLLTKLLTILLKRKLKRKLKLLLIYLPGPLKSTMTGPS